MLVVFSEDQGRRELSLKSYIRELKKCCGSMEYSSGNNLDYLCYYQSLFIVQVLNLMVSNNLLPVVVPRPSASTKNILSMVFFAL